MKVRSGFVSNSSSSSYVVHIPEDFVLTDEQIITVDDGGWDIEEDWVAAVREGLSLLKQGKVVWDEDYPSVFWAIKKFLNKKYILAEFDTGPDAGSTMGVTAQQLKEALS